MEPQQPEPSGAAAVSLRGVRKTYGDVVAVDRVSLEVSDGEFFSMLGPSGSGKTTTLRMIAGFELPTEGEVLLNGADVSRLPPYQRDVNTVFQDYALFPHMTVGDNVAYGLMVRRVGRAERRARAAEALEMVRLPGFEKRKPRPALGRPAPAGRARARAREPAEAAPARRAAGGARPEAPRGDADRAQGHPEGRRDHVPLRHPRPGRGPDAVRPDGGVQRRPDRADRFAGRGVREPGDRVRGRLRRDVEPDLGRCRARDRRRRGHVHRPAREDPPRRPRRAAVARAVLRHRHRRARSSTWA